MEDFYKNVLSKRNNNQFDKSNKITQFDQKTLVDKMINRNADKKYILAEYRKNDVLRLYKKIEQINKRKTTKGNNNNSKTKSDSFFLSHIPKNQNQYRQYQIKQQNQRMIYRLANVKKTVEPHLISQHTRSNSKFRLKKILKQRQITVENERLAKAISSISVGKFRSTYKY